MVICKFQSTHPRRVWRYYRHQEQTEQKFQSTHPRRVWHAYAMAALNYAQVSIHTPTKGVTLNLEISCDRISCFNPHTHEGCDRNEIQTQKDVNVSIHTPTKGVTRSSLSDCFIRQCFNPHTHEGCDLVSKVIRASLTVSIHTPTKGVTGIEPHNFKLNFVSIHTPTKGVTFFICCFLLSKIVSIHTPTKGVTKGRKVASGIYMFQSTHPRRVWLEELLS